MAMNNSPVAASSELIDVSPELAERWVLEGDAVLVDVREDFEHAGEWIECAKHHALSGFDRDRLLGECDGKRVVFHCKSGGRSADAANRFGMDGCKVFHLQGGIEAWKSSGRAVQQSASAPNIDVMRQVQITAGILIITGVVLGALVNPWLYGISAFVGCGLVFAGLTGWCGMAKLLARMPWNKLAASRAISGRAASKPTDLATGI
jgi:rhodanese-related sulfurtransferase